MEFRDYTNIAPASDENIHGQGKVVISSQAEYNLEHFAGGFLP